MQSASTLACETTGPSVGRRLGYAPVWLLLLALVLFPMPWVAYYPLAPGPLGRAAEPRATQSGLEAAFIGSPTLRGNTIRVAWPLQLYPGVLGMGILLSVALAGPLRAIAVLGSGLVALGLVALQAWITFPLQQTYDRSPHAIAWGCVLYTGWFKTTVAALAAALWRAQRTIYR